MSASPRPIDPRTSYTAADSIPLKTVLDRDLHAAINGRRRIIPIHIQLIPTNRCNLNCEFCSCSERDRSLEMDLGLARKIIEKCAGLGTKACTMSLLGSERIPVVRAGQVESTRIDEMVDGLFNSPAGDVPEEQYVGDLGIRAPAINDAGAIEVSDITRVYRHRAIEDLCRVTLVDGRTVIATGSHSLNVVRSGRIVKVPVRDIDPASDLIACSSWSTENTDQTLAVPQVYSQHIDHWPAPDTVSLSPELARILGYFTAEGSCHGDTGLLWCFGNGPRDASYITDLRACVELVFGRVLTDYGESGRARLSLQSVRIRRLFDEVCRATGRQDIRRVPQPIWGAPQTIKMEYLKALFSGDGNFRSTMDSRGYRRNSLHLKTCNEGLSQEVAALIRQIGARCTVVAGFNKPRLIDGRQLDRSPYFSVSVYDKTSLEKLAQVVAAVGGELCYTESQFSHPRPHTPSAPFGLEAEAVAIRCIELAPELGRPMVYDITVADTHRFITTTGIGCFNTGGGEPLLHPRLPEMIDYLTDQGIKVGLVTNGLLLHKTPSRTLDKLTWCRISNGDDRYFAPVYWDQLDRVVRTSPDVDWAFSHVVSAAPNEAEILRVVEFANLHDFTHVRLVADLFHPGDVDMVELQRALHAVRLDDQRVIYQGRKNAERGGPCYIGFLKPLIGPDGRVFLCCGCQYALAKPSRDLPDELCLGYAIDMDKICERSATPFDGSVCVRCYYSATNILLRAMLGRVAHPEFL